MIHFWQVVLPYLEVLLGVTTASYALGVFWFVSGMRRRSYVQTNERPLVSVVVAVRNEVENIEYLLADLCAQTYPLDVYEIIVVDDGSEDGTPDRVRARLGGKVSIRLIETKDVCATTGAKKVALTLGIEEARGQIILTTDGDCRVKSTWVQGMVDCFEEDVGMVVGFSQIGHPGQVQGIRAGWEAIDFLALMGCAFGGIGHGHPISASGQNLAYRKEAFSQVGGYERVKGRASGDDVLLLQLVRRLTQWRVATAPVELTATVHPFTPSWRAFLHQRVRWASNAPYQIHLDSLLFAYMLCAFIMEVLLVLTPLLIWAGGMRWDWAGICWSGKILAEGAIMWRSGIYFRRLDLLRFFPLWTLLHPFAVVLFGAGGCLGEFEWKGEGHRWGKKR